MLSIISVYSLSGPFHFTADNCIIQTNDNNLYAINSVAGNVRKQSLASTFVSQKQASKHPKQAKPEQRAALTSYPLSAPCPLIRRLGGRVEVEPLFRWQQRVDIAMRSSGPMSVEVL